jgi:hypothetical protein
MVLLSFADLCPVASPFSIYGFPPKNLYIAYDTLACMVTVQAECLGLVLTVAPPILGILVAPLLQEE